MAATPRTAVGDWQPSAELIASADASLVRYTNGPHRSEVEARFKTPTRTQLPIAPGTRMLRDHVAHAFDVRQTYMPGRSRPMPLESMRLDLHQAGRAVDFMNYRDVTKGALIADWCLAHVSDVGIQLIIHAGNVWSAGQPRGRKFNKYTGTHMHRDHPHVELTPEGAAGLTPFFAGTAPPEARVLLAEADGAPAPIDDEGSNVATVSWIAAALIGAGTVAGGALVIRAL